MKRFGTTRGILLVAAVAVAAGIVIGMGVERAAFAQQPAIKRTILLTTDDPAGANYEAVVGIAEIPPGASSGRHRHPGVEVGYVLEGAMLVEREGQAPATLSAGQAFKNDHGVHNAKNTGTKPVKILAVYLVEKGKPLAEPVP